MTTTDLRTRLARRQRDAAGDRLLREPSVLAPVTHLADPQGRSQVLAALLDHLDPVFRGDLPPDAYVHGPPGAGKSAVATALFAGCQPSAARSGALVRSGTASGGALRSASFVYVDARTVSTRSGLYRAVLDDLVDGPPPSRGVRADGLRERLEEALAAPGGRTVVAVDHVGEHGTFPPGRVAEALSRVDGSLAWVAVGRAAPGEMDWSPPETRIRVPAYTTRAVEDVVAERAAMGLSDPGLGYRPARELAAWAEGDAHDALAALFVAAHHAADRGAGTVEATDVAHAMDAVPRPSVNLGRVLAARPARKRVLRAFLDVVPTDRTAVGRTAAAIAGAPDVDLSPGVVRRHLRELADAGLLERVRTDGAGESAAPTQLVTRFPATAFRALYAGPAPG